MILPEGQVLARIPYAKRKVMKKVAMKMLKPKHVSEYNLSLVASPLPLSLITRLQIAIIGAQYIGSGLLFRPSLRERGKSLVWLPHLLLLWSRWLTQCWLLGQEAV